MFCEDVINFALKARKITKRIDFFNVKKLEILLRIVEQLKNLLKFESFVILNCHD